VWLANHKLEFRGPFVADEYSCNYMNLKSMFAFDGQGRLAAFRLLSVGWTRS
jgi:hypothetical protein